MGMNLMDGGLELLVKIGGAFFGAIRTAFYIESYLNYRKNKNNKDQDKGADNLIDKDYNKKIEELDKYYNDFISSYNKSS